MAEFTLKKAESPKVRQKLAYKAVKSELATASSILKNCNFDRTVGEYKNTIKKTISKPHPKPEHFRDH